MCKQGTAEMNHVNLEPEGNVWTFKKFLMTRKSRSQSHTVRREAVSRVDKTLNLGHQPQVGDTRLKSTKKKVSEISISIWV